ncbi:MAG TPA: efflux RND transporter periplasmic adaptor subunit [Cellvibrio sp.]|nr:efflux RND transporter periplasmic adaptor subunit [Cellvibrio sp.]
MNDKSDLLAQLRIDHNDKDVNSHHGRWIVGALIAVLLVIGMIWFFSRPDPVEVRVQMARMAVIDPASASVLDATGYVKARRYATVSSKVTGKVMEVLVEEGMNVEKDQVVARLDDSNTRKTLALYEAELVSAKTQVAETRARLTEAKLTWERNTELAAKQLVSTAELDRAKANYESLQAQLANREAGVVLAQRRIAIEQQFLDDLELRAPFAGVVISKDSQPGEMISPVSAGGGFTRTGICTLVDMASLEIEVDVNEAYIQRVRPEQPVQATLEAYPDWKIPARVIAIIPTADRQKATVRVRIAFQELDPRILPDMGVKVAFMSGEPAGQGVAQQQGIRVPASAVRTQDGERIMFVVKDNIAQQRVVQLGGNFGSEMYITSGLTPGEDYVVEMPIDLEDGDQVIF